MVLWTFLLQSNHQLTAQLQPQNLTDPIKFYCDVMINADDAQHRIAAHDVFYPMFIEALQQDNAWNHNFESLKWISQLKSQDQSFRIFSWQIKHSEDNHQYYGVIQLKDGRVFELKDVFKTADDFETEEFNPENWLGAFYYNILDVKTKNGDVYYLLFGLNRWNKFENIKIADVLHFTSSGLPIFGKDVFVRQDKNEKPDYKNRLVLKYSADAMVNLNYNPGMEMIVFDHLIPRMGRVPGQEMTLVPDGSYVGYQFENEVWNYIDKIYTQIMDEAPRPNPVTDERKKKNIFGKSGKN